MDTALYALQDTHSLPVVCKVAPTSRSLLGVPDAEMAELRSIADLTSVEDLTRDGRSLYVADTRNHVVRKADGQCLGTLVRARVEQGLPCARKADPLMGWAGSGDTQRQLRLGFATQGEAVAYAQKNGIEVEVMPTPVRKLKIQAYADNFR